jgi:hypothetical protein
MSRTDRSSLAAASTTTPLRHFGLLPVGIHDAAIGAAAAPSDIDSPVTALGRVLYRLGSMTFATQPITPLPSSGRAST